MGAIDDIFDAVTIEKDRERYFKEKSNYENMVCVKPEEHPYIMAGAGIKTTRELIHIPNDANYVEILGHKLYGDFGSFEKFCDYLKKCEAMEERWEELKNYVIELHTSGEHITYSILHKMSELEGKNS